MKKLFHTLFPIAWFIVLVSGLLAASATGQATSQAAPNVSIDTIRDITSQTSSLDPKVLQLALLAYEHARLQGLDKQQILTIINYQQPSIDKRLWVINLNDDKVLYNTYVAHGKNSGDNYADEFSNSPKSQESSIGVYVTGNTYYGNDGYSLHLIGLDSGFNSNAYSRSIVMHGAWYVSQYFIDQYGSLGRSWGCPAIDKTIEPQVVNTIKNGTVIFAYYPEKNWLDNSKYLKPINV